MIDFVDRAGRSILTIKVSPDGAASVDLFDQEGQSVFHAPQA